MRATQVKPAFSTIRGGSSGGLPSRKINMCRSAFVPADYGVTSFAFEPHRSAPCGCRADARRVKADGRSGRIRTCDPLVPNQMRYQTALRSGSSQAPIALRALAPKGKRRIRGRLPQPPATYGEGVPRRRDRVVRPTRSAPPQALAQCPPSGLRRFRARSAAALSARHSRPWRWCGRRAARGPPGSRSRPRNSRGRIP
jgi:hypothetical protein